MRIRVLLLCVFALLGCAALSHVVAFSSSTDGVASQTILYTAAKQYDALAWMRGGERFPLGATIMVKEGKQSRALVSGFFATADPDVSFDGTSVLFAGKKTSTSPWQIWQMDFPGGVPHQLVTGSQDAVRPLHLPDDVVVFAKKENGRFVIESMPLAGGKSLRLSYTPGNTMPTDILRDGRILFEAAYPLGSGSSPEIYTVYSDGSGVESYRCDHGAARYAGKQIPSGDIVFTHGKGLARFTSPLAHEEAIASPAGEYSGDVVSTASGEWLVSWRSKSSGNFELKSWKPGAANMTSVAADSAANLLQPTVAQSRPVPNRHPSGLHDWKASNLLVLNSYLSKYKFAKGSIASVRVYTADKTGRAKVLGKAPVEKDGSFYIHVPGDQPLKFELLDSTGKTLKKQNGWMWTRGGEQRVCVGCHTGPERAPDNAAPEVLLRSTDPVDMTGTKTKSQTGGE